MSHTNSQQGGLFPTNCKSLLGGILKRCKLREISLYLWIGNLGIVGGHCSPKLVYKFNNA